MASERPRTTKREIDGLAASNRVFPDLHRREEDSRGYLLKTGRSLHREDGDRRDPECVGDGPLDPERVALHIGDLDDRAGARVALLVVDSEDRGLLVVIEELHEALGLLLRVAKH